MTLGATHRDVLQAQELGYDAYLDYQLAHDRIDDSEAEAFVAKQFPALSRPIAEIAGTPQDELIRTLQQGTLYRMAFSRRQLFERMVEFWTDHFNVAIDKIGVNKFEDDRSVIRRHALGRFSDLLRASTRSVAMLGSLDQFVSRAGNPNQNYARELMELHTVGVTGGYNEHDVVDFSRVLTGWTFDQKWGGGFVFEDTMHDWGAKTVMGVEIAAASAAAGATGVEEGERIIEKLVTHPSTARFISTKLLKWLLTPAPSELQVETVAGVFQKTGGDIKAVVRAALNREWLAAAPPKFKRPAHFVASVLRVLDPATPDMAAAHAFVGEAGQPLFKWIQPDGYPDTTDYWSGTLLLRWPIAMSLATSESGPGAQVSMAPLVEGPPDATVNLVGERVFAGEMPAATRGALLAHLQGHELTPGRVRDALALAMSSPGFQWY